MPSIYNEFGFNLLADWMQQNGMAAWAEQLPAQIESGLSHQRFGDLKFWIEALNNMPLVGDAKIETDQPAVTLSSSEFTPASNAQKYKQLRSALEALIPWRKGPYSLCGIEIDTEWRSDWKWDRLLPHIAPLAGKRVLDVGCGNGYHMWRMLEQQAERVIGVDPSPRFSIQFEMVKRLAGKHQPINLVPAPLEAIPRPLESFDTVFSMGVIYHRRDYMEHIRELSDGLKPGGQLILESLVVTGDNSNALIPNGRYAKMRNVWIVPSAAMMKSWLEEAGFVDARIVDETLTTVAEQRATEWMLFESLPDFLDPMNSTLTIEGHPAPRRAILIAEKPN